MPTMTVDPGELRALAGRLRDRADAIDALDPRPISTAAVPWSPRLTAAIEQAGDAITRAYRHTAGRCRAAADTADRNADAYADSDRGFAARLDLLCQG